MSKSFGSFGSIVAAVSGQSLEWNLTTVSNSDSDDSTIETVEILYSVIIDNTGANQDGTLLSNLATVIWSDGIGMTMAPSLTVVEPVLTISKTNGSGMINGFRTIDYTIAISHDPSSTSDAYNVFFSDMLSDINMAATGTINWTAGPLGDAMVNMSGDIEVEIPHLPIGQTSEFTFTAFLNMNVMNDTGFTNTGTVVWTSLSGYDTAERSGTGGVNDYITTDTAYTQAEFIDLELNKYTNISSPRSIQTVFDYIIDVTNTSMRNATNVTVQDVIPVGLTLITATATQGNYSTGTSTWTIGTIASGATETLTLTVTSSLAGYYTNGAQVMTSGEPDVDSIPGNYIISEDDHDEATMQLSSS